MKIKYEHQITQSYWAGYLTGKLYNIYYTRKDLPSIIYCMVNFEHLKTIYGKYYDLLKINKNSNYAFNQYEKYLIPNSKKGKLEYFMIGYSDAIKKEKLNFPFNC